MGRIYDYICILHWPNPLAWTARKEFAAQCEIDCDQGAMACLESILTGADYAGAMVRLLGLSAAAYSNDARGMSALGFFMAKRRIETIMRKPGKAQKISVPLALVLLLSLIILFSMYISRGYFYPYPAYQSLSGYEYSFVGR